MVFMARSPPAAEWFTTIWDVQIRRARTTLSPLSEDVYRAVVSPDSKLVMPLSSKGPVYMWNAITGPSECLVETGENRINDAVFSPNSTRVAVRACTHITVYDIATGQKISSFRCGDLNQLAWSPDGNLLAFLGVRSGVILADPLTGQERVAWASLRPGDGAEHRDVCGLRFADQGRKFIFRSSKGTIEMYDFMSLARHRFKGWKGIEQVVWSNNESWFLVHDKEGKALIFQAYR